MKALKDWLGILPVIVALSAGVLIVLHGIWPDKFLVDFVTAVLLVIMLFSPYASLVRRIRFGEFEAEIDKAQVDRLEEHVKRVPEEPGRRQSAKSSQKEDQLSELAESEPVSAIVDLGVDIEWKLHWLLELSSLPENKKEAGRRSTFRQLLLLMHRNGVIDGEIKTALTSFADIRNRTMHGSRIAANEAARVVASGLSLLRQLDALAYQSLTPREVRPISTQEEEEARRAQYKVSTIVPYVERPERRTYVLTQEQLDMFLEGYEQYGEYLVSIEKL